MKAVELTQELVRIDTINPQSPEKPCAAIAGRLLEGAGFKVAYSDFAPGRTSLVARREGASAPLCFAGHLDTVPLGAAPWQHAALGGDLHEGKLFGRGSSDMKSGVAAMVAAALALGKGPLRKAGLTLVLLAGEETGCEGAAHLARTQGALGQASALVVGEPTGNVPVLGHKGALWLRARVKGVTAHGSMPEKGVNAVVKAARAVLLLSNFRFEVLPDPLLGPPTLNIGTFHGGLNVNSVPDEAVIGIDLRTVPAQRHAELRRQIAEQLGKDVELTTLVDLEGVRTSAEEPFVQLLRDQVAQVTGERVSPGAATYFTDASVLTKAYGGIPTVVLGPGEMALCHQTDEYCRVDRIEQAAQAYLRIAQAWCGA